MATTGSINALAHAILETVRPKALTGELITLDLIKKHIKDTRSELIRNDLDKGRSIDSYIIQDLGCVEVEVVDRAECCSTEVGCSFLRTKLQIPSPIELRNKQLITRIGPLDKIARPYDKIDYNRIPYVGLNRYSKGLIKVFTKDNDGYIYMMVNDDLSNLLIEEINVQGVFEDPELVAAFRQCDGTPCYTDESSFPVKGWMEKIITEIVIAKFIGPQSKTMVDQTSNSQNDYKIPLDRT